MASFNQVTLMGHLGRDPEMTHTTNGKAVTKFSIGVSLKRGDREATSWFEIQAWDKMAEVANNYLAKGDPVFIQGPIELNEWEGRDGEKRATMRVNAHTLRLISTKSGKPKNAPAFQPGEEPF